MAEILPIGREHSPINQSWTSAIITYLLFKGLHGFKKIHNTFLFFQTLHGLLTFKLFLCKVEHDNPHISSVILVYNTSYSRVGKEKMYTGNY